MSARGFAAPLFLALVAGCARLPPAAPVASAPIVVDFVSPPDGPAHLRFVTARPITALHFSPDLGPWRSEDWRLADPGFRWVKESGGERVERSDGRTFSQLSVTLDQRYRPLEKSYAPFSPFSDGGLLVYTGHYHACVALPCAGEGPVTIRLSAPGRTIRAGPTVATGTIDYTSAGEGTNIYIGNREPETAGGMSAIIDPGLPDGMRVQLEKSLPAAVAFFAKTYGPLSFSPQLFVSIDSRGRGDGHESTQGGTLPGQIFMHFDGAKARDRLAQQQPGWLDWFFAHEVAHMVQRDRTGDRLGDDVHAWMHEGGADAMAALALRAQGMVAYVETRLRKAEGDCKEGLGKGPLTTATERGDFDAHYSCGMVAALAIDRELASQGHGLEDFNRNWFAAVASGEEGGPSAWLQAAKASGVSAQTLALVTDLTGSEAGRASIALEKLSGIEGSAVAGPKAGVR